MSSLTRQACLCRQQIGSELSPSRLPHSRQHLASARRQHRGVGQRERQVLDQPALKCFTTHFTCFTSARVQILTGEEVVPHR